MATEKQRKYHKIQTQILVKMAKNAGVPSSEIEELFKAENLLVLH
jgi:hypothetical protein